MSITLGNAAIDRASQTTANISAIIRDNTASAAGTIDTVAVYVAVATTNTNFGIFYLISDTTYKCRDATAVGNLGTGLNTITGLTLQCQQGDFLGYWNQVGSLDRADTGGTMSTYTGNACVTDATNSFTTGTRLVSILGTGTETPAPPVGLGWQIAIGGAWKTVSDASVVIGGAWEGINDIQLCVGGAWKDDTTI